MLAPRFSFSLLFTLLSSTNGAPTASSIKWQGQCDDIAINYIREVNDLEDCKLNCDNQLACHFYSYHGWSGTETEAHHRHCYLYTSCHSLRFISQESQWVSGTSRYHLTPPLIVGIHNLLRPT